MARDGGIGVGQRYELPGVGDRSREQGSSSSRRMSTRSTTSKRKEAAQREVVVQRVAKTLRKHKLGSKTCTGTLRTQLDEDKNKDGPICVPGVAATASGNFSQSSSF